MKLVLHIFRFWDHNVLKIKRKLHHAERNQSRNYFIDDFNKNSNGFLFN